MAGDPYGGSYEGVEPFLPETLPLTQATAEGRLVSGIGK